MKSLIVKLLLVVAGVLLLFIGSALVFTPESFASSNGIALTGGPSMLSEMRAPGGLLIVSGVFILFTSARKGYERMGLILGAMVYGSYGVARLVGVTLDGLPSSALTQAMIAELIIGSLCLAVLMGCKQNYPENGQR